MKFHRLKQVYHRLRIGLAVYRFWKKKRLRQLLIGYWMFLLCLGSFAAWSFVAVSPIKTYQQIDFPACIAFARDAEMSSIWLKYLEDGKPVGRYEGNEVIIFITLNNGTIFQTSQLKFERLHYIELTNNLESGKVKELIFFPITDIVEQKMVGISRLGTRNQIITYRTEYYAIGALNETKIFTAKPPYLLATNGEFSDLLAEHGVQWWQLKGLELSDDNTQWKIWPFYILAVFLSIYVVSVSYANFQLELREKEIAYKRLAFGKRTTLKDIGDMEEAKQEVSEILEMIRYPEKFDRVGAKRPRGILLFSPPGCGKTLLARAIAAEAKVPFINVVAAEFINKFVGSGAGKIREIFANARNTARQTGKTVILFIDELDAIGTRAAEDSGGEKEYSQTINQLLTEMDGFQPNENVLVIGATNRPDQIDPAILRPGRFDRHVNIPLPDLRGRQLILEIHCKKKPIDPSVNMAQVAKRTPVGFSGADLANVANEAAISAATEGRDRIIMLDFTKAIEKVMVGSERKTAILSRKEKYITAVHEAGHTIAAAFTEGASPPKKVTIIPTTKGAGGYTLVSDKEDRLYWTKTELLAKIIWIFGGRAAEELIFGEEKVSTGAQQDFIEATKIAEQMVYDLGMATEYMGYRTLRISENQYLGGGARMKDVSDFIAIAADKGVQEILERCYASAITTLGQHRSTFERLTHQLLEEETLEEEELEQILQNNHNARTPEAPPEGKPLT